MTLPDWNTIESGVKDLLGTLLGLPCEWRNRPRTMQVGPWASVDALAPASLGEDELIWAEVSDVDPEDPPIGIEANVVGQRVLTLQVTVWSPRQTLAESARRYLEQLRTRLRFPSTQDALRALGLGLVDVESIVDVNPVQDGRTMSQASLDLRLAYAAQETDAVIPWIETAEIASEHVLNAAGEQAAMQVSQTVVFEGGES